MQKFQGQGSNLCHNSDPSHSSDNATSLTIRPPRNSHNGNFKKREKISLSLDSPLLSVLFCSVTVLNEFLHYSSSTIFTHLEN